MELTKSSVLKLVGVTACVAVLCLTSVMLLGVTLRKYWEYKDTEDVLKDRLSELRNEIVACSESLRLSQVDKLEAVKQLDFEIAEKRSCVEMVSVEHSRYVALTNRNAAAENEKNVVESEIATKQGVLKKLDDDLISSQTKLDATSEKVHDAEATLKKLKEEIIEGEKRKSELSGIEETLARKSQEVKDVDLTISEKRTKLEERNIDLIDMEKQIATLEERKSSLTKKADDLEEKLRIQAPKENALKNRLSTLEGEYLEVTNRIVKANAEAEVALRNANERAASIVERANSKAKEIEKKSGEAIAAFQNAEQKRKDAEEQFTTMTNKIVQIRAEIGVAEATKNKINEEICKLEAKEKALAKSINSKLEIEKSLADGNAEKNKGESEK